MYLVDLIHFCVLSLCQQSKRAGNSVNTANRTMINYATLEEVINQGQEGFTFDLYANRLVTSGIVVAYAETQDAYGPAGLLNALRHAIEHDGVLGGWLNSENQRFYFDSCKIFRNLEEAKAFAIANKQLAFYWIEKREVIWIEE